MRKNLKNIRSNFDKNNRGEKLLSIMTPILLASCVGSKGDMKPTTQAPIETSPHEAPIDTPPTDTSLPDTPTDTPPIGMPPTDEDGTSAGTPPTSTPPTDESLPDTLAGYTEHPLGTFTAIDDRDSTIDQGSSVASLIVYGRGGNDIITTGAGNDLIYGGDGADIIHSGPGNDVIVVYGSKNEPTIGEIIDGGTGENKLLTNGIVNLTGTTIHNINILRAGSEVYLTPEQFNELTSIYGAYGAYGELNSDQTIYSNLYIVANTDNNIVSQIDFSLIRIYNVKEIMIYGDIEIGINNMSSINDYGYYVTTISGDSNIKIVVKDMGFVKISEIPDVFNDASVSTIEVKAGSVLLIDDNVSLAAIGNLHIEGNGTIIVTADAMADPDNPPLDGITIGEDILFVNEVGSTENDIFLSNSGYMVTFTGNGGADTFLFTESASSERYNTDVTIITDFNLGVYGTDANADKIDLSSLLKNYTPGVDDINDYIHMRQYSGDDVRIAIDIDGVDSDGGFSWDNYITLEGIAYNNSLLDNMINDGQLILD